MDFSYGATTHSRGTTFRVYAPHATSVRLVLHDDPSQSYELQSAGSGDWLVHEVPAPPGTCYVYYADGEFNPLAGQFFSADHPLLDPYSRGLTRRPGSGGQRPLSVVCAPPAPSAAHQHPRRQWSSSLICELHVVGYTALDTALPAKLRGTYAGLAHPGTIERLRTLGITAVELLPVQAIGDEAALTARGTTNYWGYSTLSYFAVEPTYATAQAQDAGPQAVMDEFARMVAALHNAGIEVFLDVVYNHTAEGGVDDRIWHMRGLAAAEYYRLDKAGRDVDVTGCGGTVNVDSPVSQTMIIESLRYWVQHFGIDGFRFDLAVALGRGRDGFSPDHPLLQRIRSDSVLKETKLIAEPWDIGSQGWQTGAFGAPWAEWNDVYRDRIRAAWWHRRGAPGHAAATPTYGDLRGAVEGTPERFGGASGAARGPSQPVNFITAHDGFTAWDLSSYTSKRNDANGEANRDGTDHNLSFNHGVEGEASSAAVRLSRSRTICGALALTLLAAGVPMLLGGDEWGNSQSGNNNPYCRNESLTWIDWERLAADSLRSQVHRVIADFARFRHQTPSLFSPSDTSAPESNLERTWFDRSGRVVQESLWSQPLPHGDSGEVLTLRVRCDDVERLITINTCGHDRACVAPATATGASAWIGLADSTTGAFADQFTPVTAAGSRFIVPAWSVRLSMPHT